MKKFDFSGWATRNDVLCSDGRIIRQNAFIENNGETVPLVWNHGHGDVSNVLGHALLENRPEGVYFYGTFNGTKQGLHAKEMVKNKDITAVSIFANKLKQSGSNVLHGLIKEVSLVLAGANPGAYIENVMMHSYDSEYEAVICFGDEELLYHYGQYVSTEPPVFEPLEKPEAEQVVEHSKSEGEEMEKEKTVKDVIDSMTEEQKQVMYGLINEALKSAEDAADEEDDVEDEKEMKHNVFNTDDKHDEDTLLHAEFAEALKDGKKYGSLKESFLEHGITNVEYLFPDAKTITNQPVFQQRNMAWVTEVMNGVHKTPFSRIKSLVANITEEDARAKGYIKGSLKKDEVFSLLKRTTSPTTIYKKQKIDRDDVLDITDFDVVAWLKAEMRTMLDEEIARAILVGDGRLNSSDDKIKEDSIRPIYNDAALYTVKYELKDDSNANVLVTDTVENKAKAFINGCIESRSAYKGSGSPSLFVSEAMLTACLLLKDSTGRFIYDSEASLAKTLRVAKIVPVEVLEGVKNSDNQTLAGIIVNLNDYRVGADKGGAINMFDDFDIDYNAQKYLIETRCSGALALPHSAIALFMNPAGNP